MQREEYEEYLAALVTSATYNVNRKKDSQAILPDALMFRSRSRRPERAALPVAPPTVRLARPGERPPSMRPPGMPDNVIERFDAFAARQRARRKF